jgi:hypothetical protein
MYKYIVCAVALTFIALPTMFGLTYALATDNEKLFTQIAVSSPEIPGAGAFAAAKLKKGWTVTKVAVEQMRAAKVSGGSSPEALNKEVARLAAGSPADFVEALAPKDKAKKPDLANAYAILMTDEDAANYAALKAASENDLKRANAAFKDVREALAKHGFKSRKLTKLTL